MTYKINQICNKKNYPDFDVTLLQRDYLKPLSQHYH